MSSNDFTQSDTFHAHRRTDDDWEVWSKRGANAEAPRRPLISGLTCTDATRICLALNAFQFVEPTEIPNNRVMRMMMQLRELEVRRKSIIEQLEVS